MFDMTVFWTAAAAAVAGIALGGFYFGGLWWTVHRMLRAQTSLKLYFGSLWLRVAVLLLGFYAVTMAGDWRHLVASFAGFLAARIVLVRILGRHREMEPDEMELDAF